MKNNCLIIFFLLVSIKSFSQNPLLFEHTWRLEKILNPKKESIAILNEDSKQVVLNFNATNGNDFVTTVCSSLFGELEYTNFNSFTFDLMGQTNSKCDLNENELLEEDYFNFFDINVDKAFTFELNTDGDDVFLVIRNFEGKIAFYVGE